MLLNKQQIQWNQPKQINNEINEIDEVVDCWRLSGMDCCGL